MSSEANTSAEEEQAAIQAASFLGRPDLRDRLAKAIALTGSRDDARVERHLRGTSACV